MLRSYSENAGILGILSSGAARNHFLPVQSDTYGCSENALKMLGFDVGSPQSGITYRRINPYGWVPVGSNSRHLASLSYKKPTAAAVGTLETKRKFRRFILIIAVKFYFKMKTPTQKKNLGLYYTIIKIPVGQSQSTVQPNGTTKRISSSSMVATLEIKKEASTIHPHHCSKILFQNEDSHWKKYLGRDSSLSLSKYRLVDPK